jgi:hypothetical protein
MVIIKPTQSTEVFDKLLKQERFYQREQALEARAISDARFIGIQHDFQNQEINKMSKPFTICNMVGNAQLKSPSSHPHHNHHYHTQRET